MKTLGYYFVFFLVGCVYAKYHYYNSHFSDCIDSHAYHALIILKYGL